MSGSADSILRYVDVATRSHDTGVFSTNEQAVLDTINQQIGARESLESVLGYLAESLRDISPCDRFSLAFFEDDGRRVVSRFTRAFYEPVVLKTGYAEDMTGSSLQTVLDRGVPRIITDLPAYLEQHPESRSTKILAREGVRSSLTCPLFVDGRVVGLLFRSSRKPDAYNDHQVWLHLAIAERLSQVVEKTYRIEQLDEANRAYFEMLGFVVHELKSPIGSMMTEAGLLRDGYVGELEPRQRERLEKLIAKGQYLMSLVSDYLNLARLEGEQKAFEPHTDVDVLTGLIAPAIEIVRPQFEVKNMRLEEVVPTDLPPATLDPTLIKIVLVNLLGNAAKYGRENGTIRITTTHAGDRLRVAVWNEGPGFPEGQRSRLFRKFSRIKTPELMAQKGTGVGLYSCWRIIQMHGGRIDATSEHGQWAEFTFEIPQLPPETNTEA